MWLKHQTFGELDDSKLVDGLTGERYKPRKCNEVLIQYFSMVFKRRGVADKITDFHDDSNPEGVIRKKYLRFIKYCSANLYLF